MKPALSLLSTSLLLPLALGGCGAFFRINAEQDPQQAVNQRVLGLRLGEFFERYGAPTRREESTDGVLGFNWSSPNRYVAAGPVGPEEQFCRLRVVTERNGRIASATIVRDGRGTRHQSRCVEIFGADAADAPRLDPGPARVVP